MNALLKFTRFTNSTCALWVLSLGACSVLPVHERPTAALDAPLSQAPGWHLGTEETGADDRDGAGTGTGTGTAEAAALLQQDEGESRSGRAGPSGLPVVGLLSDSPLFDDPVLDALLKELGEQNLRIRQAAARLRQAEAALSGADASRWPQLGVNLSGRRSNSSGGSLSGGGLSVGNGAVGGGPGNISHGAGDGVGSVSGSGNGSQGSSSRSGPRNSFTAGASISWTPDLWGRVAAQVAASEASLAVAEADRQAVVLQMQVSLVQAYWRMRLAEARLALLQRSIGTTERSLQLTQNQYKAGLVARADVIQAQTQWQGLVTQRHGLARHQAIERHAIAALLGKAPALFRLPEATAAGTTSGGSAPAEAAAPEMERTQGSPTLPAVPELPETLSIDLLRRRPDVRAAEQKVVAANAGLGIARGAWLPDLSFSSAFALGADTLADLISSPLRTWSLGSQLAAVLFDGGARRAELARQEAAYDETVAAYRQQVLTAVQDIEDQLLTHRTLALELADQQALVALAEASERVVRNRYQSGLVNYLELASAQRLTINSQEALLNLQAERLAAHVNLLAALGGRW
ncbi:MAG: efflux transporter outer membrane subunit [Lautropia sp.]|nr:efflux transporter outer membrane subunit [Lautropia sp.]